MSNNEAISYSRLAREYMESKYHEDFIVEKIDTWTPYLGSRSEVNILLHPKDNKEIKMLVSTIEGEGSEASSSIHFSEGVQAGKFFAWFNYAMPITYREMKFSYELEKFIESTVQSEFSGCMFNVIVKFDEEKIDNEKLQQNVSLKEFINLDEEHINNNMSINIEIINFTDDFEINEKEEAAKAIEIYNSLTRSVENLSCDIYTNISWYRSDYRTKFDEYYKKGIKHRMVYCVTGGSTDLASEISRQSSTLVIKNNTIYQFRRHDANTPDVNWKTIEFIENHLKEKYGLIRVGDEDQGYRYNCYNTYKNENGEYCVRYSFTFNKNNRNFIVEMPLDGTLRIEKIGVIDGEDTLLYGDIIEADIINIMNSPAY